MSKDRMPFNYCDYRCERCEEREACPVYQNGRDRIMKHIVKGEDPYDPGIFAGDIKEIYAGISENVAGIGGPGPQAAGPAAEPDTYVLYRLACQYCIDAHALVMRKRHEGVPHGIGEEWGDFVWYHTLLPAKTARLVISFDSDRIDPEWQGMEQEGTIAVISKSVSRSRLALKAMGKKMPEDSHEISDLLEMLDRFEKQLDTDMRQKVSGGKRSSGS